MNKAKNFSTQVSKADLVEVYRLGLSQGMSLEELQKKVAKLAQRSQVAAVQSEQVDHKIKQNWIESVPSAIRFVSWVVPIAMLLVGVGLLGSATLPILGHLVGTAPKLQAAQLQAPIPQEEVLDIMPIVISKSVSEQVAPTTPTILDVELDYTNLNNWFSEPKPELAMSQSADEYILAIPKLKLANVRVKIGGTNLSQNLIQYPGTALPGQVGAPVIFGHSVLRQFYNPSEKNPRRYSSIFSTLMTLQKGDEIFITYQGIKYAYVVSEKTEVKPEDTYILSQRHDARLLKLVTCVPEGTYLRRGVITAQLTKTE